jgi:hypothetical protein
MMNKDWQPFCGAEYGLEYDVDGLPRPNRKVAGDPVICDQPVHPMHEMHFSSELGFGWWGNDED